MDTEVMFVKKGKSNIGGIMASQRKLLVLDTSFSYEAITKRRLQDSVTCRDLDGFFQHVWSVHPFSTLVTSEEWLPKFGTPNIYEVSQTSTFIEGKVGRYKWLSWFPLLNFLLSQLNTIGFLIKLIKEEKITVIRAGDMLYLGLLGLSLSRLCKIPLVIRVGGNHDKIYETTGQPIQKRLFFSRKFEKLIERFVLKRADLVAGANKDNLNFALANGAKPEKSTLFRYGNLVDKLHFVNPELRVGGEKLLFRYSLTQKQFILYIGRLESVKHPEDVIHVFAEVRRRGFNLKLLMVGDGRQLGYLQNIAKDYKIEDYVVFSGNIDQESLSLLLPHAAVVLSPHTGRALTEAALAKTAIVAYNIDWQSEVVETGVTGELVPHKEWRQMAESTVKFLQDPEYSCQMAVAVRERIINMMSPEKLNQHEREEYLKLLSNWSQKSSLVKN